MRIDPNLTTIDTGRSPDRVEGRRVEGARGGVREVPGQTLGGDETILSPQAQDMRTAMRHLAQVPEVRQDKVAACREQIAQGTFEIDAEVIADKLLAGEM